MTALVCLRRHFQMAAKWWCQHIAVLSDERGRKHTPIRPYWHNHSYSCKQRMEFIYTWRVLIHHRRTKKLEERTEMLKIKLWLFILPLPAPTPPPSSSLSSTGGRECNKGQPCSKRIIDLALGAHICSLSKRYLFRHQMASRPSVA